jgi:hypothetical protein
MTPNLEQLAKDILETFDDRARKLVEREAKKRGRTALELLKKQVDRYINDAGYTRKINRLATEFLKKLIAKQDVTKLVPGPLDWITVRFILTNQAVRIWGYGPTWKGMRTPSKPDPGQN